MGRLPWLLDPTVCRSCRRFLLLIVDRDIGDISRALSRTSNFPGRGLCANQTTVLLQQFAHIRLPQRHGNPIHASLNPRSKIVCLERILSAKFAGSFGDCGCQCQLLGRPATGHTGINILSSCRLSTRACFWFRVIRIFFLEGLPVGVFMPSSSYASRASDLRLSEGEAMANK